MKSGAIIFKMERPGIHKGEYPNMRVVQPIKKLLHLLVINAAYLQFPDYIKITKIEEIKTERGARGNPPSLTLLMITAAADRSGSEAARAVGLFR